MIRRPIQNYFFFGTAVRYLEDATAGTKITDYDDGLAIRSNLKRIMSDMQKLNLRVSQQTIAAERLETMLKEFEGSDETSVLSTEHEKKLRHYVRELRQTLEAELRATYAYSLTPKRVDISRLIDEPESLFGPDVYEKLPAIAKYDFGEAGRAIAFELPTAAASHLMRATEAVLRVFYSTVVRTRRTARTWGEIVTDIRKRRIANKHAALLNHLDHIRHSFRNPTQHPDAQYRYSRGSGLMEYRGRRDQSHGAESKEVELALTHRRHTTKRQRTITLVELVSNPICYVP